MKCPNCSHTFEPGGEIQKSLDRLGITHLRSYSINSQDLFPVYSDAGNSLQTYAMFYLQRGNWVAGFKIEYYTDDYDTVVKLAIEQFEEHCKKVNLNGGDMGAPVEIKKELV